MSMFDRSVRVTGKYAFSFTTYVFDHEWDGNDYAYFHDVGEREGRRAYHILENELGVQKKSRKELFRLKFGQNPDADDVFDFCMKHDIQYEFHMIQD